MTPRTPRAHGAPSLCSGAPALGVLLFCAPINDFGSLSTFGTRALVVRFASAAAARLRPDSIGDLIDDIFDLARHVLRHQTNDRVHEPLLVEAAVAAPAATGAAAAATAFLATRTATLAASALVVMVVMAMVPMVVVTMMTVAMTVVVHGRLLEASRAYQANALMAPTNDGRPGPGHECGIVKGQCP